MVSRLETTQTGSLVLREIDCDGNDVRSKLLDGLKCEAAEKSHASWSP